MVLPSVFEEQIEQEDAEQEAALRVGAESVAEASSFLPPVCWVGGPHLMLETIRRARAAVDIPVIASLNGVTAAGWVNYAAELEQAGASAIELNVYFVPTDPALTGGDVEAHYLDVLQAVKRAVRIPVAVKLSPFFSAPGDMVRRLDAAGADGFVLFNRFYQPDIDLATMRVQRDLALSTPAELRLPLAVARGAGRDAARVAGCQHRGGERRAGGEISAGGGGRGDDHLGVVAPWGAPYGGAGRGAGGVAGCARG